MPYDGSRLNETTKTLIAARSLVERGWCQNKMRLGGDVCMVGAMHGASDAAWVLLGRAIGEEIAIGYTEDLAPIVDWNDTKGRTKKQVLAAFDRAIAASL